MRSSSQSFLTPSISEPEIVALPLVLSFDRIAVAQKPPELREACREYCNAKRLPFSQFSDIVPENVRLVVEPIKEML